MDVPECGCVDQCMMPLAVDLDVEAPPDEVVYDADMWGFVGHRRMRQATIVDGIIVEPDQKGHFRLIRVKPDGGLRRCG
jgi:hypothetical protein